MLRLYNIQLLRGGVCKRPQLCPSTYACKPVAAGIFFQARNDFRLLWASDVKCIIRCWIMTMNVTDGSNGGEQQRQTATSALWEDKEAGKGCAEGEVGVSRDRCYDPL